MSDSRFVCTCGKPAVWEIRINGRFGSRILRTCPACRESAIDNHGNDTASWSLITTPINRYL